MTDAETLVRRMAPFLRRAMTDAGHLAQVVTQEHRGGCSWRACSPACLEAQAVCMALAEYLGVEPTEE